MEPVTSAAIRAVWEKVHSPSGLPFPATVAALAALGVTRYRIDYAAATATSYLDGANAGVDVASLPVKHEMSSSSLGAGAGAAPGWDADALVAAIRSAQAGTIGNYHDFSRAAIAAGVTDYACFITGRRVVYSGALGDIHTEWFPGSKKD